MESVSDDRRVANDGGDALILVLCDVGCARAHWDNLPWKAHCCWEDAAVARQESRVDTALKVFLHRLAWFLRLAVWQRHRQAGNGAAPSRRE